MSLRKSTQKQTPPSISWTRTIGDARTLRLHKGPSPAGHQLEGSRPPPLDPLPRSSLQLHYCCGIEHCITLSTRYGYLLLRADLFSIHQPCRYHHLAASRVNQHMHRSTIQVAAPKIFSTPLIPSQHVAALGIQGLAGSRSGWCTPAWTVEHEMPVFPTFESISGVCLRSSLDHRSPGSERGFTHICLTLEELAAPFS